MLLDRGRKAGRYLEWKVRIFSVAAVLALVGIYLESGWMTGAAMGLLALGLLLRLLPDGGSGPDEGEVED
jgi:hypothetical protein